MAGRPLGAVCRERQDSCLLSAGTPRGGTTTVGVCRRRQGGAVARDGSHGTIGGRSVRASGPGEPVREPSSAITRRDDRVLPWGAAVFCCACLSGAALGVGGQYGTVRRSGRPRPSAGRDGDERAGARVHHRFPVCSGRPSTGALSRAGDRDLAVAMPRARARDGISRQEPRLTFDYARPLGRSPPHRRRGGLHRPHARPGRGHPARPRGSRRPRRRPDRHRQDRRLRPARSSIGCARTPTPASRRPATRSAS